MAQAALRGQAPYPCCYKSNSLNSFKGDYIGDYMGSIIQVIKGDTRTLD